MSTSTKPVPDGYPTATPYLMVKDAAKAIDFYKRAFGATESMRMEDPQGRIAHAEIRIGNSPVMLCDEFPEMGARSPLSIGGSPVMIYLYVEDVDKLFDQAVDAGAQLQMPVTDQFYGDRAGKLGDPFGHIWWIASHKEDVPEDELRKRAAEMFAGMDKKRGQAGN
jgi:PhnB protein